MNKLQLLNRQALGLRTPLPTDGASAQLLASPEATSKLLEIGSTLIHRELNLHYPHIKLIYGSFSTPAPQNISIFLKFHRSLKKVL